jgi:shikimate dehydrogenase
VKCAVLGDPIDHSLSPTLHQAAYAELEMSDWSYTSTRVQAGGLARYVADLGGDWPPSRWRGLSVTMPLKREAYELARSMSPRARLVGAVNTLVRSSHGWVGDNTDLPGAVAAIRERAGEGFSCASGAILGAGATAASTGLALAELGASRITLLARNPGAAGETIEMISRHPSKPVVSVLPLDSAAQESMTSGVDVVVSTVPAKAQTPELIDRWASTPVVFDVVYDPWPSPLLSVAPGVAVSGLDLLVHQAVLQFELFTGRPAPLAAMRAAGEKALGIMESSMEPTPA